MIPKDAITEEEYSRWEKGLPPLPKKKVERPEPEFPKITNRIDFESVPLDKVVRINAIRKNVLRNREGIIFIGYDTEIEVKDSKPLQGWIGEGDLRRLISLVREKTDQLLLHSIGYK
jgi:hypothetical protein